MCPANMSEGRRYDVVARIALAAGRPGVQLLDVHTDPDHNRSVLTFAGEAGPLVEGLVAATRTAADTIDLATHRGVHPRLGAMDVVPFVPVGPSGHEAMEGAVAAARRYARAISDELGIPSFLYEEAGDGRALPDLRRLAFAGLVPDHGGPDPHPTAGAVAVGARGVLVAYNVDLDTGDIGVARRIAAAIRERGGGLPYVRALGLALPSRGVVQVSTNLIRPAVTPIGAVFDAVEARARAEGIEVAGSEVVGLVPRAALPPSAAHLRFVRPPRILEEQLARLFPAAMLNTATGVT